MGALFRKPRLNSSSPIELILTYGALLVWLAICLFPLYWLGTTSFKIQIDVYGGPKYLPFVDYQPSLNAWTSILSQKLYMAPIHQHRCNSVGQHVARFDVGRVRGVCPRQV